MKHGLRLFFCLKMSICFSIFYGKDCYFSAELPLDLCQKSIDHTYVGVFLDSICTLKTPSDNTIPFAFNCQVYFKELKIEE